MNFISRFSKSKSKDSTKNHRRQSTPPATTPRISSSYLPLSLPSSSLLRDESLAIPLRQTTDDTDTRDDHLTSRSADTSRWVEVAPEEGGGGGGGGGASLRLFSSPNKRLDGRASIEDPAKVSREMIKLEKSTIEIEQMIKLMDECGEVIRSRGLTTLGIFRPFRLPESPALIRQLCLLFLDYASEFDLSTPTSSTTARGTLASKTVKLHRFREELRYAEIHDVVAVLKWGLQHFSPSTPFALPTNLPSSSSSCAPRFDFYRSYLVSTSNASCPHSAFSKFLSPLLTEPSRRLLVSTLQLVQAVSAYSELNAMTCRRLCRTIGYYLFADPERDSKGEEEEEEEENREGKGGWEKLYERWRESGEVLEGLAKSYLWEQQDLPPRLEELVIDYPMYVERAKTGSRDGKRGRTVRVLKVVMESRGEGWRQVGEEEEKVNDQETGYLLRGRRSERGQFVRRKPVDILADAFEAELVAEEDSVQEAKAWKLVVDRGKEGGVREVLDQEVIRVLDLLGLSSKTQSLHSEDRPSTPRRRVTSGPLSSLSEEYPSNGVSSIGNFPNKSVSHLSPTLRDPKRTVTPSWNDFARTGFSNGTSALNVADEFGRFDASTPNDVVPARRTPKRDRSRIVKLDIATEIEEEFADLWLDTLVETTTTSSPTSTWPSLIIAPLHPLLSSSLALQSARSDRIHLLVYDKLLPLADLSTVSPPPSLLQRNLSRNSSKKGRSDAGESTSLNPRNWTKRASSIFGGGGVAKRESSFDGTNSATRSKTKKSSRRSMFFAEAPPSPVPVIPRRSSMDPSASPEPYSTSPPGGNFVTRTMRRRKSKSSISSKQSEDERQLASSPPKFESELAEPVPAIPAKYSMEVEEAKRRSQASPDACATKSLPEEPDQRSKVSNETAPHRLEAQVEATAVPLAPVPRLVSAPAPETPLKDVLLQGQPILGAALSSSPAPTENTVPFADSPTISRAAAIRTPSSEAPSLLLKAVGPSPIGPEPTTTADENAEYLATPFKSTTPLDSTASPTFTLSPPGGEPEELPVSMEEGTVRGVGSKSELTGSETENPSVDSPEAGSNLGLGLSNVEQPIFEAPPIGVPPESFVPASDFGRPVSPPTLAAPSSPTVDPSANPDSPTIPASPSPSGTSQGSNSSKKFLARTRSFLSRKKSASALDKEKAKTAAKAEAKQKKVLRSKVAQDQDKLRQSTATPKEVPRKLPTPVSSVKKRVAELEAANAAETGSRPSSPITASRILKGSSPEPTSPSPLPSSLPHQPGSAASSIVPLPSVDNELPNSTENQEETQETPGPVPENPASEASTPAAIEKIKVEELSTEAGSLDPDGRLSEKEEPPFAEQEPHETNGPGENPQTVPSVVVDQHPASQQALNDEKVPASPEAVSAPISFPTPHAENIDETRTLGTDESFSHSPLERKEEVRDAQEVPPNQEADHLSVKVPASLEDLPSPPPTPTPAPLLDENHGLHQEEVLTESHSELAPLRPSEQEDPEPSHERQGTETTVVPMLGEQGQEQDVRPVEEIEIPHTPLKNAETTNAEPPSILTTPLAPSAPLFSSTSTPSRDASSEIDDPFLDHATPVKSASALSSVPSPPSASTTTATAPALVSSESQRSISTRTSLDTFETANGAASSVASSIHEY